MSLRNCPVLRNSGVRLASQRLSGHATTHPLGSFLRSQQKRTFVWCDCVLHLASKRHVERGALMLSRFDSVPLDITHEKL